MAFFWRIYVSSKHYSAVRIYHTQFCERVYVILLIVLEKKATGFNT